MYFRVHICLGDIRGSWDAFAGLRWASNLGRVKEIDLKSGPSLITQCQSPVELGCAVTLLSVLLPQQWEGGDLSVQAQPHLSGTMATPPAPASGVGGLASRSFQPGSPRAQPLLWPQVSCKGARAALLHTPPSDIAAAQQASGPLGSRAGGHPPEPHGTGRDVPPAPLVLLPAQTGSSRGEAPSVFALGQSKSPSSALAGKAAASCSAAGSSSRSCCSWKRPRH